MMRGQTHCVQGEWAKELVGPDVWQTCRELIPPGSVFSFLAEHRQELFPAAMFADMYPSPNGPTVAVVWPARLTQTGSSLG